MGSPYPVLAPPEVTIIDIVRGDERKGAEHKDG